MNNPRIQAAARLAATAALILVGSAPAMAALGTVVLPDSAAVSGAEIRGLLQPPPPPAHPEADSMGSTIRQHEPSDPQPNPGVTALSTQPLGMDVSSYQGNVDWNAAAANGAKFAYVKASEGTGYLNPYFRAQYNGAYGAGLARGAYHFALPNQASGAAQANYFVDNGGSWSADGRTLPPMLDIEYNPYGGTCYGLSPSQMSAWIADFSNTVRSRTGRYPMIYSTTGWWNLCTGYNPDFGATNPLFLARYSTSPGPMPAGWGAQTLWQYSDLGTFPGDQDVFNGSESELQSFLVNSQAGALAVATTFVADTPGGPVTATGSFGANGDLPLACNWTGSGKASLGTFRNGIWSLSGSITSASSVASFAFGNPGDQPICGDWNGDGIDTVGVYRNGQVFLRNSNSEGPADGAFEFGIPGDIAVVGDWNGDGFSTLSVRRGGLFYLTNSNITPTTDGVVAFGSPGDKPVAGDWNGDGYTTLGVVRSGTWYLANSNLRARTDQQFGFGNPGDVPITGAWNGGRMEGVGVVRY